MKLKNDFIETDNYKADVKSVFDEMLSHDPKSLRDLDITDYFLAWYLNRVIFNVDTMTYHVYNGKYYKEDVGALLLSNELSEFITEVVAYANRQNVSRGLISRLYFYKDKKNVRNVVELIKMRRRKESKDIDTDIYLFNCQNGILDLSGSKPELINHSPKHLITQISDVEYNPELGEVTGEAKELLLSFFMGNEGVLNFMFEYLGISLTGYSGIRKFVFAFGSGKNGKSTFFNFFLDKFFGNYGASINFESFTKDRNHNGATSDLVRIMNKRLAITNETKEKLKLNTNLIKTITGGDKYQARLNYQNEKTYFPKCKIVLFGNNQLKIDDSSEGMTDRFVQVPFLNKFKGEKTQEEIWEVLGVNKSQILNSLIAGYYRYKEKNSFNIPENIKRESLNGFSAANNFVRFLTQNMEGEEGADVKTKDIFKQYKKFAEKEGLSDRETLKKIDMVNKLRSSGMKIFHDSKRVERVRNYRLKDEGKLF